MAKKLRIAINGFGRIGRNSLKAALGKKQYANLEFVAINDLTDTATLAHLFQYDTCYGTYPAPVSSDSTHLIIGKKKILVTAEKDPTNLPWAKLKVDIVLECTGRFTSKEGASAHLVAGAKAVIISAPAKGGGVPTYVMGVNQRQYKKDMSSVVNNASCTTNCIAPVAAIVHELCGIKKAMMTTVHAYTADQNIQDGPHSDLRRARAAAENIVPTSTGAAIATAETIPDLAGIFDGLSLRVPVPVVSLSDLTIVTRRKVTADEVNKAFVAAAGRKEWQGILAVTSAPVVSSDMRGNMHSAIVDLSLTKVVDGDLLKVVAWYDNEWGYSHRLIELAGYIGASLQVWT